MRIEIRTKYDSRAIQAPADANRTERFGDNGI
jgi:hypothetical protein